MIYSISERNIAFCLLCGSIWFVIAIFMTTGVEVPYELFNATSGNIETGTHIVAGLEQLSYLFMGLGAIMFIISVTFMLEFLTDYRKIR